MNCAPFARDAALAVLGAALMLLAFPPSNLWPLGLVAWVPLALIASSGAAARSGAMGWLQGALTQAGALSSIPVAFHDSGGASLQSSWLLATVLVLFEGARSGVIGLLAARVAKQGWPLVLALPAAIMTSECFYPMVFPWRTWLLFHKATVLLQGAELGGPAVLSLWAGVLDASLATAWLHRREPGRLVASAVVVPGATLALVAAYGALRMRAIDASIRGAPAARVGLVQGNLAARGPLTQDSASVYRSASLDLRGRENVDLLVWPETAIPYPVRAENLPWFFGDHVFRDAAHPQGPRIDRPLLAGMVVERAGGTERFNSAVLATPDGRIRGIYDKRDLLMLGEYPPSSAVLSWAGSLMAPGSYTAGTSSAPLVLDGRRILVLICYEDILGDRVRSAVRDGHPELLVNLTSDAWFGRSRVPDLHLALAILRAVEHRRFLVHATNTGASAVVDPVGRTTADLPPSQRVAGAATVHWMQSWTPFEAIGDAASYAAAAALGCFLGLRVRRRARRSWEPAHTALSIGGHPRGRGRWGRSSRSPFSRGAV